MTAQMFEQQPSPAGEAMRAKILCVDDEPNVLASLQLLLARDYEVHTAAGGQQGLELLSKLGAVSVVVSDMRMPGMSGSEFLAQVARLYPECARILLTGATDIGAAVEAINTGNLFRFLLKPCASDQLRATLAAGLEHHRLRTAEKELLQQTLLGSIRALTEVLAIADPVAFGRTGRLKELAVSMASRLSVWDTWPIEYAALVCQLGNISLPEATAKKLYGGQALGVQERLQVEAAMKLSLQVIRHIPRLEQVTQILQELAAGVAEKKTGRSVGARILQTVLAYEALERTCRTSSIALKMFLSQRADFDSAAADALIEVLGTLTQYDAGACEVNIAGLHAGMVTAAEIRSTTGALLVSSGTQITASLLAKLLNFPRGLLPAHVQIRAD